MATNSVSELSHQAASAGSAAAKPPLATNSELFYARGRDCAPMLIGSVGQTHSTVGPQIVVARKFDVIVGC